MLWRKHLGTVNYLYCNNVALQMIVANVADVASVLETCAAGVP